MLKKLLVVFLISLGSITSQTLIPDITSGKFQQSNPSSIDDTVRILGVMVNFQEDKDASTFGNGKFGSIYSQDYGNSILDPLPHNQAYFESHLEFIKNYYSKVSGNKQFIEYYILPDTFSVSKTMRNYSPAANTNDFTPLGEFAAEVWRMADSIYPRFDFSHYNLFSIFHAGVGRDITLPGSLGNERDLPSVYLGINTLRNIYGNDFEGFLLENNNFRIPNSMIIPETESRELSSFGSTFLFEITINGLIAANVASHLGLPDLFDTNTGLSAIGRFGLMDGQAIFAYNGLFPPEPSAWEKIKKGWAEAIEIEPGNYDIKLVTKIAASLSDTVILKVPLNASEYYLVENRIRDANGDGAILKYVQGGEIKTRTFLKDTTGFYSYDVDSVEGVVIDVDEFDWALPGNGIVIWHIDENIIAQQIEQNKINNDKFNRGVDVEEADGIQDIGERFLTIFGDEIIGEGTLEDLWYSSNPADLYTNRFDKNTRPDTRTNSGANSLITFSDFSDVENRMTFKLSYGDSIIRPVFAVNLSSINASDNNLTVTDSLGYAHFSVVSDSTLYWISDSGRVENSMSGFSRFKPAAFVLGGEEYLIGTLNSSFRIFGNGVTYNNILIPGTITAPPLIRKTPTEEFDLLIGTLEGKIYIYSLNGIPVTAPVLKDSLMLPGNYAVLKMSADGFYISVIGRNNEPDEPGQYILFDGDLTTQLNDNIIVDYILTKDRQGNYVSIILDDNNEIRIYSSGALLSSFTVPVEGEDVNSISAADLRQDGENYILISASKLYAINLRGAPADNFPFEDPAGIGFTGIALAADFEGDRRSEVIAYTKDGRIFAVDGGSGKIVNGFPLSAGEPIIAAPALFNYRGLSSLALLSKSNNLFSWVIGSTAGTTYWSEENSNHMNTSFAGAASNENFINEFFPVNRAYNYPNPVYGGSTFIRYYVSESAKINIKIFDLSGDFVAELNDDASGGMDNETVWDVNDIQSGVYLARVEANSHSGKSESTIIKIAVVK